MCKLGAIAKVTGWPVDLIIREYDHIADDLAATCRAILKDQRERQEQAAQRR